jgi:hypothetical protein
MTNDEFRPCPGCGCKDIKVLPIFQMVEMPGQWPPFRTAAQRYVVQCQLCAWRLPSTKTKPEAIEAWNLKPEGGE